MIVNQQTLRGIYLGFNALFNRAFEEEFQSTRSAWSATVKGDKLHKKLCCFLRQQKHKFAKEIVLIV